MNFLPNIDNHSYAAADSRQNTKIILSIPV